MDAFVHAFVVLLLVIDPIGVAWLFGVLVADSPAAARRAMALRGVALAAGLLLLFFFLGAPLLHALGITLPAFRIAGGVLLFLLAIDMIFARQSGLRSTTRAEKAEAAHRQDVSVFPLAFPLLAGPGALTTMLLVAPELHDPARLAGMLAVLALVLGLTLGALLAAPRIVGALGETGANVISRVLGLVLAALAVQYVLDGLGAALRG